MTYTLHIKRQDTTNTKPYWQDISYTPAGPSDSIATALERINQTLDKPIGWQRSCLVRKCGACAIRIDGIPRLACATFLRNLKGPTITLEPLRKFPVVHDLIVDRSVIYKLLQKLHVWSESTDEISAWKTPLHRESARCLQCGCCLDVCPNFIGTDDFSGAVGAVNAYRNLDKDPQGPHHQDMEKAYDKLNYRLCNQSLACHDICPAHIPVDELTAHSNAIAIWHKK